MFLLYLVQRYSIYLVEKIKNHEKILKSDVFLLFNQRTTANFVRLLLPLWQINKDDYEKSVYDLDAGAGGCNRLGARAVHGHVAM